jgi:hypothetical protein
MPCKGCSFRDTLDSYRILLVSDRELRPLSATSVGK